jgi:cysteine desulfuration protein SufE
MSAPYPEALQVLIDELNVTDELTEKYEILIEIGQRLPELDAAFKTPANVVQGCQSLVHAQAALHSGKLVLLGQADAMVVNGLLALLVLGCSGLTPRQFLDLDPGFIKETGIIKTLTPSRVNGFYNIHERFHRLAAALEAS